MNLYRITLPEGVEYAGYPYVLVQAPTQETARLTVTRATGVAARDQGYAMLCLIGPETPGVDG